MFTGNKRNEVVMSERINMQCNTSYTTNKQDDVGMSKSRCTYYIVVVVILVIVASFSGLFLMTTLQDTTFVIVIVVAIVASLYYAGS